jgi:hypothetical protein
MTIKPIDIRSRRVMHAEGMPVDMEAEEGMDKGCDGLSPLVVQITEQLGRVLERLTGINEGLSGPFDEDPGLCESGGNLTARVQNVLNLSHNINRVIDNVSDALAMPVHTTTRRDH